MELSFAKFAVVHVRAHFFNVFKFFLSQETVNVLLVDFSGI